MREIVIGRAEKIINDELDSLTSREKRGPLKMLTPFRKHYMNGQLPWKILDEDPKQTLEYRKDMYELLGLDDPAAAPAPTRGAGGRKPGGGRKPARAVGGGRQRAPPPPIPESIVNAKEDEAPENAPPGRLCPKIPSTIDRSEKILNGEEHFNATNELNITMFQLAIKQYTPQLDRRSRLTAIDTFTKEVLKALQAMQAEMAVGTRTETQLVLRDLADKEKYQEWMEEKFSVQEKFEKHPFLAQFEEQHDMHKFFRKYLDFAFNDNSGPFVVSDRKVGWTWDQEMTAMETKPFPGTEDMNTMWPGFEDMDVPTWLEEFAKMEETNLPLAGKPSWTRLSNDYVAVSLMLVCRPITLEELMMAEQSAGRSVGAGEGDIVQKLTMHRLEELSFEGANVFHRRMMAMFNRDMKNSVQKFAQFRTEIDRPVPQPVLDILMADDSPLMMYATEALATFRHRLATEFAKLFPFDASRLNGRLPFATISNVQNPEENEIRDLRNQYLFAQVSEKMLTGIERREDDGALKVSEEILDLAHVNLHSQTTPENTNDYEEFNESCLKYFKSIHTIAIDECRPRIKKMMASIYQEESLRSILTDTFELRFSELFADCREKAMGEYSISLNQLEMIKREYALAKGDETMEDEVKGQEHIEPEDPDEENPELRKYRKGLMEVADILDIPYTDDAMMMMSTLRQALKTMPAPGGADADGRAAIDELSCKNVAKLQNIKVSIPVAKGKSVSVKCYSIHSLGFAQSMMSMAAPKIPNYSTSKPAPEHSDFFSADKEVSGDSVQWSASEMNCNLPLMNPVDEHYMMMDVYLTWGGMFSKKNEKAFSCLIPMSMVFSTKEGEWAAIKEWNADRGTFPNLRQLSMAHRVLSEKPDGSSTCQFDISANGLRNKINDPDLDLSNATISVQISQTATK